MNRPECLRNSTFVSTLKLPQVVVGAPRAALIQLSVAGVSVLVLRRDVDPLLRDPIDKTLIKEQLYGTNHCLPVYVVLPP